MSQPVIASYQNNFSYRKNYSLNEEDHKLFSQLPFKYSESEVESGSFLQISRRDSALKNEMSISEHSQNQTILQTLNLTQKGQNIQQTQEQLDKSFTSVSKNTPSQQIQQYFNDEKSQFHTAYNEQTEQKTIAPIRLMKVLKILVNVYNFFKIVSMNARILSKLTQHQHDLIGDVTSFYSIDQHQKHGCKFFFNIQLLYRMCIQKLSNRVFKPSNYLIKAWNSIQSLIIIFSTFLLNLELFFEMEISRFQLLFQILFFISVIDIFIELNTGVLKKGSIITDRSFILKQYLKKRLVYDLVGNMPLFFYVMKVEVNSTWRIINNFLFTLKWIKISKVLKQITFYVSYEKDHKNMFDLLRLLVFVIGICHIFCLFWHGLVIFEINNGITDNWLASKNLLDASIFERYVYSFYFLAVTMATVGYGDITPQNSLEVLFTTITIFVTCVVYAFSLNTIGGIIENIEKKDKKYKENLQIIHGLMREEDISRELKIQVSNYIEYLYKKQNETRKKQEKMIIEKLSTKLKNDLTLQIQGKYLSNIPLFKELKEKDKVAKIMEEQLYSPSETIFTQGDIDDCSLYYIVKGSVSIQFEPDFNSKRESKQIQIKEKKGYFGEISFITGNRRTFTAKATDFCKIYKINREQFLSVIKEDDHDFETFQMLKEDITLHNNFEGCSIFCSTCKSGRHYSVDCFSTHLTFSKRQVISKFNVSSPQERTPYNRHRSKLNNLEKIGQLQDKAFEIINRESLFEAIKIQENDNNYIDYLQDDENISPDNLSDFEKFNIQREREFSLQFSNEQCQNQNNQVSKAYLNMDDHSGKTPDHLSRQSKHSFSYVQSQSLNSMQKMVEKNQQQKQQKKSFIVSAGQQIQLFQEQNDQMNNNQKNLQIEPESPSSDCSLSNSSDDSNDDAYSKSSSIKKKSILSKQSFLTNLNKLFSLPNHQNNDQEDFQKQSNYEIINDPYIQSKGSYANQIRNSVNFNLLKQQLEDHLISEMSNQYSLNDAKLLRNNQKDQNTLPQDYKTLINQNDLKRRRRKVIHLENFQNQIQNIQIQLQDQQNGINKNPSNQSNSNPFKITQQISPVSSQKQGQQLRNSIKQNFHRTPSNLNESSSQYEYLQMQRQNIQQDFQKFEKKINENNEFPDLGNYLMLQIFDKAKIFKYYLPNYNYPEIVKKWVMFQSKKQKRQFITMKTLKNKRNQYKESKTKWGTKNF